MRSAAGNSMLQDSSEYICPRTIRFDGRNHFIATEPNFLKQKSCTIISPGSGYSAQAKQPKFGPNPPKSGLIRQLIGVFNPPYLTINVYFQCLIINSFRKMAISPFSEVCFEISTEVPWLLSGISMQLTFSRNIQLGSVMSTDSVALPETQAY